MRARCSASSRPHRRTCSRLLELEGRAGLQCAPGARGRQFEQPAKWRPQLEPATSGLRETIDAHDVTSFARQLRRWPASKRASEPASQPASLPANKPAGQQAIESRDKLNDQHVRSGRAGWARLQPHECLISLPNDRRHIWRQQAGGQLIWLAAAAAAAAGTRSRFQINRARRQWGSAQPFELSKAH